MLYVGERAFTHGSHVGGAGAPAQTPMTTASKRRRAAVLEEDDEDAAHDSSQPGTFGGYEEDD